jgi:hypothetical protein
MAVSASLKVGRNMTMCPSNAIVGEIMLNY